jgi:hypothetical protein
MTQTMPAGVTQPPVAPRGGVKERVRHLRVEFAVAGILLVIGAVVAGLAHGSDISAGVGLARAGGFAGAVALVALSYTLSTLAIAWADSISSQLVFPVGVGMYVFKFSLLAVFMVAIGETTWNGKIATAVGIVLAVVAWTSTQIWWTVQTAHPFVKDKT